MEIVAHLTAVQTDQCEGVEPALLDIDDRLRAGRFE
ncbi:hypothetical protein FHS99_000389 [Sphingomonas prati]|uniref:Uncharacterized protein n=1 Tax=Sphingomonas prati TaxID=1843237 RepID=A0A7W9BPW5_9SPHN|nr:hypothetical protein [Sphingomonas prati]